MLKQKLSFLAALQSTATPEVKSRRLDYMETSQGNPLANSQNNNNNAYNLIDRVIYFTFFYI